MSDEDVSAEDTRYIQAGFAGRHTGKLLFAGVREEREREREREIYGRVLSICDISRALHISFENRCMSVASKYDKVFNFASQRQRSDFED